MFEAGDRGGGAAQAGPEGGPAIELRLVVETDPGRAARGGIGLAEGGTGMVEGSEGAGVLAGLRLGAPGQFLMCRAQGRVGSR